MAQPKVFFEEWLADGTPEFRAAYEAKSASHKVLYKLQWQRKFQPSSQKEPAKPAPAPVKPAPEPVKPAPEPAKPAGIESGLLPFGQVPSMTYTDVKKDTFQMVQSVAILRFLAKRHDFYGASEHEEVL